MIQRKDFVRLKGALNEAMKKSSQGQDGDGSKEPTLDEVLQGQTIFEVLGGEAAIEAVVERFYLYVYARSQLPRTHGCRSAKPFWLSPVVYICQLCATDTW